MLPCTSRRKARPMKKNFAGILNDKASWKENRLLSFSVIIMIYLFADLAAYFVMNRLHTALVISLFTADAVATGVVFFFSVLLRNASCYDPYWSVAPMVMIVYLGIRFGFTPATVLLSIAVMGWGLRLTMNWAHTFDNLTWQDWRYTMLHQKTGRFYPLINFIGIHMVPTIVVFLVMYPVILAFAEGAELNIFTIIFFLLSVAAFTLQGIADKQMHRFRSRKSGGIIQEGLWKYSRHPNYLGEIMMWWSVGFLCFFSMHYELTLLLGALVNTCLFLFVSIPMAETRQLSRHPEYAVYQKRTSMLIPLPRKK